MDQRADTHVCANQIIPHEQQESLFYRADPVGYRPNLTSRRALGGLIYGLSLIHPYQLDAKKLAAFLLQASIVALGWE